MKAVILVAGREKNFYPVTEQSHQCLLNVRDKTIIENMLDSLAYIKVDEVILVVGHKSRLIKNKLGKMYNNMKLNYVKNEDYDNTGTLSSVAFAKEFVYDREFILIDGDVLCDEELIYKLSKSKKGNILLVDFKKGIEDGEMGVNLTDKKVSLIKRADSKSDYDGVFIGISKLSKSASKKFFDAIQKKVSKHYYEDILEKISKDEDFQTISTEGFRWIKVDKINEFKNAKEVFGNLKKLKDEATELGADVVFKVSPSELVFDDKVKRCKKMLKVLEKR